MPEFVTEHPVSDGAEARRRLAQRAAGRQHVVPEQVRCQVTVTDPPAVSTVACLFRMLRNRRRGITGSDHVNGREYRTIVRW